MNMDIDTVFNTLSRTSKTLQFKNQYRNKLKQIKACESKRCGNCDHWMKDSCEPERKFGQFKTIDSSACKDFILSYNSKCLIEKFTKELHEIEVRFNKSK